MDISAIMALITSIITMIMEFLGGGSFDRVLSPDQIVNYHLASYQWSCTAPAWDDAKVTNGVFNGTVKMTCEVEGTNGAGLVGLRDHMLDQLSKTSSQVHDGPRATLFQGLPSQTYDHSLIAIDKERNQHELRGKTEVATDGVTRLRHVFQATSIPSNSDLRYLKAIEEEIQVKRSLRSDRYVVTLRSTSTIAKPWFVSNGLFRETIQSKLQEKLVGRRERVMNDLASKL